MRPADLPKDDEIRLALYVLARHQEAGRGPGRSASGLAWQYKEFHPEGQKMSWGRLLSILEKWSRKDRWDSGVTTRSGWIPEYTAGALEWFIDLRETVAKIDPAKADAYSAPCPIPESWTKLG